MILGNDQSTADCTGAGLDGCTQAGQVDGGAEDPGQSDADDRADGV